MYQKYNQKINRCKKFYTFKYKENTIPTVVKIAATEIINNIILIIFSTPSLA